MSKTLFRPVNYLAQSCRIWKDRMRLRLGFVSPTALTRPSQGFRRQWVNTLVIPDQTSTTPALEHLATYWLSTQWPWAGQVLLNGCAHANQRLQTRATAFQTSQCCRPDKETGGCWDFFRDSKAIFIFYQCMIHPLVISLKSQLYMLFPILIPIIQCLDI